MTPDVGVLAAAVFGAALLVIGCWLDRCTIRYAQESHGWLAVVPLIQFGSLGAVFCAATAWLVQSLLTFGMPVPLISAGVLAVLLLVHAGRWRKGGISDLALAFPVLTATLIFVSAGWTIQWVVTLVVLLLSALWWTAPWLNRRRAGTVLTAFGPPAVRVATFGLALLLTGYMLPVCGWTMAFGPQQIAWLPMMPLIVWAFDASHWQWATWTVAGWISLLAFGGATAVNLFSFTPIHPWLPAVWAALSVAAIPVARMLERASSLSIAGVASPTNSNEQSGHITGVTSLQKQSRSAAVARILSGCILTTLALIAVSSLLVFDTAFRVAGGISLVGLLILVALGKQSGMRLVAMILVNWQVLCAIVQVFCPGIKLTWSSAVDCALSVALVAAVQSLFWQRANRSSTDTMPELAEFQSLALKTVAGVSLLATLQPIPAGLATWQILLATSTFAVLAAQHVIADCRIAWEARADGHRQISVLPQELAAVRQRAEAHVWRAIAVVAAGIGYLALFDVFAITGCWSVWLCGHWDVLF